MGEYTFGATILYTSVLRRVWLTQYPHTGRTHEGVGVFAEIRQIGRRRSTWGSLRDSKAYFAPQDLLDATGHHGCEVGPLTGVRGERCRLASVSLSTQRGGYVALKAHYGRYYRGSSGRFDNTTPSIARYVFSVYTNAQGGLRPRAHPTFKLT